MTSPSAFLLGPASNQFLAPRIKKICSRRPLQPHPLRPARAPRAALDGLRKQDTQNVDPATGRRQSASADGAEIDELGVERSRSATAVLFVRADILASGGDVASRAVVFLHGFSQRPRNYGTMLRMLAAQGHIVIAPRVWLLDIAWPTVQIPGAALPGKRASMPAKLQTALLTDAFRCIAYVVKEFNVKSCSLLGHSMGGAMALVAARAMRNDPLLSSVSVLAPAVGPTVRTAVNEFLCLNDGGDLDLFCKTFGDIPVMLLHGKKDRIVPTGNMDKLFLELTDDRAQDAVALRGEIADAGHIGFEDSVEVDLPVFRILDILLFRLIDAIVFSPFDVFVNTAKQLESTKKLVRVWCECSGGPGGGDNIQDAVEELGISKDMIMYTWDGVQAQSVPS